jgi:peptide/nickel transport system substrate-binding protein
MRRRRLLTSVLAGTAALAAPRVVRAGSANILKFIPQSDLATLDPMFTTASVTRCHAHLVFDTLYGMDNDYAANPQMVAGHVISQDGLQWDLTLREGLRFHDGSPVLARDAVASIQRWWQRDAFGAVLAARTNELSAPSDSTIRFRLRKPFALLPDALAVIISVPVIMPEHLARTDPFKQVTEMIGSGPFRFKTDERVPGSRVVYEKFSAYIPRADRNSHRARRSFISTGSNGPWCPIRRPPRALWRQVSSIGGRTRRWTLFPS